MDKLNEKFKSKIKVIKNAKFAKELWNKEIDTEKKENFKRFFHIRPTTSGFTIVSTHAEKPMNGIQGISCSNLKQGIDRISDSITNKSVKWENSYIMKKTNNKDSFKTTYRSDEEYKLQAKFINMILEENKELKDIFEVKELYFIGSEVILPGEEDKIDVLAYGKTVSGCQKLFFIEIKKAGNVYRDRKEKAFEQVKRYIEVYSKDQYFVDLIKNYPMLNDEIEVNNCLCEGWVVKGNTKEEKMMKKDENYIEIFQP